ncbi:MAG: plasmid pRiA4b ORF-3 family protein [Flavobacteriales bacterium]|nr:plasmid pRiA4b ORF-3 family protein [Flavobacteriales bacterium]
MDKNGALQLKITLKWSKPPIWRRIVVPVGIDFMQLHLAIQSAMGWENAHLYEFKAEGYRIGQVDEDFADFGFGDDKVLEAAEVPVGKVLTAPKDRCVYEYDFGDGWLHNVLLEKGLPAGTAPGCTAGALACPPEDCGGMAGYAMMLQALSDPKHPEHDHYRAWAGRFDATRFELAAADQRVKTLFSPARKKPR